MIKNNIPTAAHKLFDFAKKDNNDKYTINEDTFKQISSFIKKISFPIVVKADGLAAGKGV